jgi:hypothetical protein
VIAPHGSFVSFGYDLKNGGPVPQQVWHVKEPSLLKALSAKHCSPVIGNVYSHQIAEKLLVRLKTNKLNCVKRTKKRPKKRIMSRITTSVGW